MIMERPRVHNLPRHRDKLARPRHIDNVSAHQAIIRKIIIFGEQLPQLNREHGIVPASAMSFSCLRAALGSMPSATSLRISSRRSRAFFNPTSGYTPSEIRFSLPAKRYLKRHQRLPPSCQWTRVVADGLGSHVTYCFLLLWTYTM